MASRGPRAPGLLKRGPSSHSPASLPGEHTCCPRPHFPCTSGSFRQPPEVTALAVCTQHFLVCTPSCFC